MGERVEVNGHPTWVDQHGSGDKTILVMHGGLSNSDTLEGLTNGLAERIWVDISSPADSRIRRSFYPIFHPIYWRDSRGRSETVSD